MNDPLTFLSCRDSSEALEGIALEQLFVYIQQSQTRKQFTDAAA